MWLLAGRGGGECPLSSEALGVWLFQVSSLGGSRSNCGNLCSELVLGFFSYALLDETCLLREICEVYEAVRAPSPRSARGWGSVLADRVVEPCAPMSVDRSVARFGGPI
jgi:hypothetical protein